MATRGIRILIILPLLVGACAGLCWLAIYFGGGQLVMAQPDQQVRQLLREISTGQLASASLQVSAKIPPQQLRKMGTRLVDRYGQAVITSTEMLEWTPDRARVWSQTRTASGATLAITWVFVQRDGQWVVIHFSTVDDIFR
ncbi:MAG: hypothetical protein ACYDBB_08505 [Armatimonadota bacterium]